MALRQQSAAVLGIHECAATDEIRAAFRRKALETHPDKGGDALEFRRVKSAYEVLCGRSASLEGSTTMQEPANAASRQRSRTPPRRQPRKPRTTQAKAAKAKQAPSRPLSPRAQARSMGMFPSSRAFSCPC
eukprot:TRINITY_DN103616_c0_g1_i1.p2 TRINITY_DN103616_c0_g1~~TRINITY_DN103616_c0_g1_i1.p2  ORF type:complete len:131 (+),score=14.89 TRINITY_DN103616_c0_g1_i1:101-493(+)